MCAQLLCLTYPMIGNYGVPDLDSRDDIGLPTFFESEKIHATALIVAEYSHDACHWNLTHTLSDWLKQHNVPGIYGIDTRALTKHIREQGAMLGKIVPAGAAESSVPQVQPAPLRLPLPPLPAPTARSTARPPLPGCLSLARAAASPRPAAPLSPSCRRSLLSPPLLSPLHPASLSLRCPTPPLAGLRRQVNPNDLNLVAEVSLKEPRLFVSHAPPRQGKDGKRMRILAIDCGIKANIIRYFMSMGVELLLVPWDYDFSGEAVDAPLPLRRHAAVAASLPTL